MESPTLANFMPAKPTADGPSLEIPNPATNPNPKTLEYKKYLEGRNRIQHHVSDHSGNDSQEKSEKSIKHNSESKPKHKKPKNIEPSRSTFLNEYVETITKNPANRDNKTHNKDAIKNVLSTCCHLMKYQPKKLRPTSKGSEKRIPITKYFFMQKFE